MKAGRRVLRPPYAPMQESLILPHSRITAPFRIISVFVWKHKSGQYGAVWLLWCREWIPCTAFVYLGGKVRGQVPCPRAGTAEEKQKGEMNMKKVTAIILALVLAFSFSALPAWAEEEAPAELDLTPSEGLEFESNGDGTCSIVGIGVCKDTNLVIPTQSPAGDTVTLIGEHALWSLEDVDSVTLANYEYTVDTGAFQYGEFETLNIIGGAPVIADHAFSSCEDLTTIQITGCSDITLDKSAFFGCGDGAAIIFSDCTGTLDDTVFQYGDIDSLTISGCTLEIGDHAFSSCEELTSIVFTDSDITVEKSAFFGSGDGAALEITGGSSTWEKNAFQYGDLESLTVTGAEITIGDHTFGSCEDLATIAFSESTVTMDDSAFSSSGDKAEMEMTDCAVTLGKNVFQYASIQSLTASGDAFSAEDRVFSSCEDLESVTIDCGEVTLGDSAFSSCSDLESVSICESGSGQVSIDDEAFRYCGKLTNVVIGGEAVTLGDDVFNGCAEGLVITIAGTQYTADALEDGLD